MAATDIASQEELLRPDRASALQRRRPVWSGATNSDVSWLKLELLLVLRRTPATTTMKGVRNGPKSSKRFRREEIRTTTLAIPAAMVQEVEATVPEYLEV